MMNVERAVYIECGCGFWCPRFIIRCYCLFPMRQPSFGADQTRLLNLKKLSFNHRCLFMLETALQRPVAVFFVLRYDPPIGPDRVVPDVAVVLACFELWRIWSSCRCSRERMSWRTAHTQTWKKTRVERCSQTYFTLSSSDVFRIRLKKIRNSSRNLEFNLLIRIQRS